MSLPACRTLSIRQSLVRRPIDSQDNVIIADDQNGAIRKYDPETQTLTTVLGRGVGEPAVRLNRPHGVCVEKDKLYVVDTGNDRVLVVQDAQ